MAAIRARWMYEMIDSQLGATRLVGYNHLISNKREWHHCFVKNNQEIFIIIINNKNFISVTI